MKIRFSPRKTEVKYSKLVVETFDPYDVEGFDCIQENAFAGPIPRLLQSFASCLRFMASTPNGPG
jgi:hypothetical protein